MIYVRVTVVRWVDQEWPGWVEAHLRESDGTVSALIDKVPIFDYGEILVPGVDLPVELEVPCEILAWTTDQDGKRSAVVRLRFNIEDQNGRDAFRVFEGEIVVRS